MKEDKTHSEEKDEKMDALRKVNLNDYAGDDEDNRQAAQQANRYMEDLDRAQDQRNGNINEQPAE